MAGLDRSRDQAAPRKFAWLESPASACSRRDGSGVTSASQCPRRLRRRRRYRPGMVRARALAVPRMSRAELLSRCSTPPRRGIAVGGTSGKSTVTG